MAGHLKTKGGHEVTVYNRTTSKAQKWVAQFGGRLAVTPKLAADGQDFVMAVWAMTSTCAKLLSARDGAFKGLRKGAVFGSGPHHGLCGDRPRASCRREAAWLRDHRRTGIRRPGRCRERHADRDVRRRGGTFCTGAEKVIAAYARACNLMGAPGSGQLAKMVNQICIAGRCRGSPRVCISPNAPASTSRS